MNMIEHLNESNNSDFFIKGPPLIKIGTEIKLLDRRTKNNKIYNMSELLKKYPFESDGKMTKSHLCLGFLGAPCKFLCEIFSHRILKDSVFVFF